MFFPRPTIFMVMIIPLNLVMGESSYGILIDGKKVHTTNSCGFDPREEGREGRSLKGHQSSA